MTTTLPPSEAAELADKLEFAANNTEGCLYSQRKMLSDAAAFIRSTAATVSRDREAIERCIRLAMAHVAEDRPSDGTVKFFAPYAKAATDAFLSLNPVSSLIDIRGDDVQTKRHNEPVGAALSAETKSGDNASKNTFLICPVRGKSPEFYSAVVSDLEARGFAVHWPPRDTDQNDPTGLRICSDNAEAIRRSDVVHIIWDGQSQGCLFDLGVAFALGKAIEPIELPAPSEGKSFQNMIRAWSSR